MAIIPASRHSQSDQNQIWDHLKQAIAATSGFRRWQLERSPQDAQIKNLSLDHQVKLYLRETLETLAY
ncbi:hypothetical protein [Gloeocapsopsis dulcis]|uniref:Uncharacterized protein n=1 Tax=Gloeocapsopsis dulcis AAB1 = 1H9 TaxID=1433147 RepID=A0A6N8FTB6_9CHRO|nr:hypothetical protein [Gloeocapsopsis dulcis]MUL36370.1 hypothetical protein [Gloeocapsopsis dulcis AAB1 = 1H9]WNN88134.1 hypothetical protein P0S91_17780 [Gloeocapsopsis dulcis]